MVNVFGPYSPHVASVGCANNSREVEQADGGLCVFESVVINFATISGKQLYKYKYKYIYIYRFTISLYTTEMKELNSNFNI
jgi:hypothetical protein